MNSSRPCECQQINETCLKCQQVNHRCIFVYFFWIQWVRIFLLFCLFFPLHQNYIGPGKLCVAVTVFWNTRWWYFIFVMLLFTAATVQSITERKQHKVNDSIYVLCFDTIKFFLRFLFSQRRICYLANINNNKWTSTTSVLICIKPKSINRRLQTKCNQIKCNNFYRWIAHKMLANIIIVEYSNFCV